jgi:HEAT repeat protein
MNEIMQTLISFLITELQLVWVLSSNFNWTTKEILTFLEEQAHLYPVLLLLVLSAICIILIISILTIIIVGRILRSRKKEKTIKAKELIDDTLIALIFSDLSDEAINEFEEKYLKNTFYRNIAVASMITISKSLNGSALESLRMLYVKCHLEKISMRKIKDSHYYIVAQGIQELCQMNIKEAYDDILALVNHSNKSVRNLAQISLVKLRSEEPLAFLNHLNTHLSDWQQMNIYNEIRIMPHMPLSDFTGWLKSENRSVVIFAIRMIGFFHQFFADEALIELLKNTQDEETKSLIIHTLGSIQSDSSVVLLSSMYPNESILIKRNILQALGKIGEFLPEEMLLEEVKTNTDYHIRLESAKLLLKGSSKEKLYSLMPTVDENVSNIFKHVIDNDSG